VRRDTGRGKGHSKIRDLFADERCGGAVLGFLSTTDVGKRVPGPADEDVQSEVSESELREREGRYRRGGRRPRRWKLKLRNGCGSSPHQPSIKR
jgi:hypothetical protein